MKLVANGGVALSGTNDTGEWIEAQYLRAGHRLHNADNSWSEVVSVDIEKQGLKAYNLHVDQFHTFYVRGAANDNAKPVWVHNACDLFSKLGIKTTKHFRNRLAGRASRGITAKNALDAYRNGRLFHNPATGNYVRHSSRTGVSVITDRTTGGTAVTVFNGKPSSTWVPVKWRKGL